VYMQLGRCSTDVFGGVQYVQVDAMDLTVRSRVCVASEQRAIPSVVDAIVQHRDGPDLCVIGVSTAECRSLT